MQVALNGDEAYRGGRLVFANAKQGFVVPKRPAGSATIHTHAVPLGVSVLEEGVRYGLFLCDTKGETVSRSTNLSTELSTATQHCEQLRYLVDAALQNLDLYAKAIPFILATPDDALYRLQREYNEELQRFNHIRLSALTECGASSLPQSSRPSFSTLANEVFWHVHTLFPRRFSDASTSDGSDDNSLDLVAACRRHVKFMQQLLVDVKSSTGEGSDGAKGLLERALREYVIFLTSLRGDNGHIPVPSLIVDHMWHSHMAFPGRTYTADCLRLCGRMIDHVVEEDEE